MAMVSGYAAMDGVLSLFADVFGSIDVLRIGLALLAGVIGFAFWSCFLWLVRKG